MAGAINVETGNGKFLYHDTGLPLRVAGHYRRVLADSGNWIGQQVYSLMTTSPVVGHRGDLDRLPHNVEEVVRLRRVASDLSKALVNTAQTRWGVARNTTVLYGSVALGVVRHPSGEDQSDVDVDIVMDTSQKIPKEEKNTVIDQLRSQFMRSHGVRINPYIWTRADLESNSGDLAKIFVRSGGKPLEDTADLWSEILFIAAATNRFLSLGRAQRKVLGSILNEISTGRSARLPYEGSELRRLVDSFLEDTGVTGENILPEQGREIAALLCKVCAIPGNGGRRD